MRKLWVMSGAVVFVLFLLSASGFSLDKADLVAPGNGQIFSVGEEIEFTWLPVEGAERYLLGVTGPGRKQVGKWLYNVCVYKFSFDRPGKYYWRVAVEPGTRNEVTSLERYFIVE